MAKKPEKRETSVQSVSQIPGQLSKWGGQAKAVHLPSGAKLIMEEDCDCILLFLGSKDISDKLGEPEGSVIYQTFHDGRRFVSMPNSYALTETKFIPYKFYYIHHAGNVQTKPEFNPMKDFEIAELGAEGETVPCDLSRTGSDTIILSLPVIAELNYTKMNYPLRKK